MFTSKELPILSVYLDSLTELKNYHNYVAYSQMIL